MGHRRLPLPLEASVETLVTEIDDHGFDSLFSYSG
jgi:hypothetical protein